ncbi:MAG: hypothetical protein N2Z69_05335 [Methylophilaceae bacterium]|nr:hypothetical protein [Methylophilaceae bacterium]
MTLIKTSEACRFGVKGQAAASWLTAYGLELPDTPNSWCALDAENRVLRLGRSEFMVEGPVSGKLENVWTEGLERLYRVPRYDAGFVLEGAAVSELLSRVCTLDTRPEVMGNRLLFTFVAGVVAILACETSQCYRLWCDAGYGNYMQRTLWEILDSITLREGSAT